MGTQRALRVLLPHFHHWRVVHEREVRGLGDFPRPAAASPPLGCSLTQPQTDYKTNKFNLLLSNLLYVVIIYNTVLMLTVFNPLNYWLCNAVSLTSRNMIQLDPLRYINLLHINTHSVILFEAPSHCQCYLSFSCIYFVVQLPRFQKEECEDINQDTHSAAGLFVYQAKSTTV